VSLNHNPAVDTTAEMWEPSGSHLGSSSQTLTKVISSSETRLHTSFLLFHWCLKDFIDLAVLPK